MEKPERVLRKPELYGKLALSDATIWRLEHQGKFPKRITLGGKSVGWLESEVNDWLKAKAEAREHNTQEKVAL
jgi:prophage regulatory protein